ncbi:MAG: DUF1295 domain-containing protein [bacterium]|nr:DUF1295 domain-containing protein [bacterium]MDE0290089.1 DUF1295 domain-containing protein [bacterium]MDE0439048.1 DUF1295 domain-containing protein [bacterium]
MFEWLGIGHLVELPGTEAIWGYLTPLVVFAGFFVLQLIVPGRRVPGYVINPETGEPRRYRLNGLLVFAIVVIVWYFELTGMPRDWFYRSTLYAVAGGTVVTLILAIIAVYSQPPGEVKNPLLALWIGRAQELSLFNKRIDIKMYFYVVGGTMVVLNGWSAVAYHYDRFGEDANPGVVLYTAFFTWYIVDYFIFERVQLYTYDLIHERMGFKMFWGGLLIYGWMFTLPLWGMAVHPDPGFSSPGRYVWLIGASVSFLFGWGMARGAAMQKYTFKRWPDRKFLGFIEPEYIEAGDRKILVSGFWGLSRHMNYGGEGFISLGMALAFGHFTNLWAWTYFIFVAIMFTTRERYDNKFCEEKYGPEKWAEYKARVKYRIYPWVY